MADEFKQNNFETITASGKLNCVYCTEDGLADVLVNPKSTTLGTNNLPFAIAKSGLTPP